MPVPFKNDAKKLHKFLVSQIQKYMKRETPQDQVSSQEGKAGLTFKWKVINKEKRKLQLSQEMEERN